MDEDVTQEVSYDEISRVAGPEGGELTFYYDALPQDKPFQSRIQAILDIPAGALTEEVIINIENEGTLNEPVWTFSPDIAFSQPVNLSYQAVRLDSNRVDAYCYYGPVRRSGDEEWLQVADFEYDATNNLVSIEVDNLNGSFSYEQTIELEGSFRSQNYFYCQSTNPEFLEIDLSTSPDIAGNNLLVIPESSIIPPAYLEIVQAFKFDTEDDVPYQGSLEKFNSYYKELLIDGVYILPLNHGDIFDIKPGELNLDQEAAIYLELSRSFPFNVDQHEGNVKIYQFDSASQTILGEFPATRLEDLPTSIFTTSITQGGVYSLGVEASQFEMWMGGTVSVHITGEGIDLTLDYSSADYGGADIFCVPEIESCIIRAYVNRTDGYGFRPDEYTEIYFFYDYGTGDLALDSFDQTSFYYLDGGVQKSFKMDPFDLGPYAITTLDKSIAGGISGEITAGAYDEAGSSYTATVTFDLRISSADSGSL